MQALHLLLPGLSAGIVTWNSGFPNQKSQTKKQMKEHVEQFNCVPFHY